MTSFLSESHQCDSPLSQLSPVERYINVIQEGNLKISIVSDQNIPAGKAVVVTNFALKGSIENAQIRTGQEIPSNEATLRGFPLIKKATSYATLPFINPDVNGTTMEWKEYIARRYLSELSVAVTQRAEKEITAHDVAALEGFILSGDIDQVLLFFNNHKEKFPLSKYDLFANRDYQGNLKGDRTQRSYVFQEDII